MRKPNVQGLFDNTKSITCPRCGYDQRGVVATWTEDCPLNGVCSECGLEFGWAELLNPSLFVPDWCVESRKGIMGFPLRAMRTLGRTLAPWRLWRGIRMTHPPRWGQLAAYHFFLLALLYVIASISNGLMCVHERTIMSKQTFGQRGGTVTVNATAWHVFLHGAGMPFSNQPTAIVTIPATAIITTSGPPAGQWGSTTAIAPVTYVLNSPRAQANYMCLRYWRLAAFMLFIPLACTLAFAALPVSRRRAKVRWAHLGRAMWYSYGLVWVVAAVSFLAAGENPYGGVGTAIDSLSALAWIASPLLLIAFWWATASLYLRMQHGWAVALSVTVIGILTPFAVGSAIWMSSDY